MGDPSLAPPTVIVPYLDLVRGFVPRVYALDAAGWPVAHADGPDGFTTWEEAAEAARFLRVEHETTPRTSGAPEALGHANIGTTLIYAAISTTKRRTDIAKYLEGGQE
jgi:hypothetical protein